MNVSRRDVEILRKAQLEADRSKLEPVASAQISYGLWQKQDGGWKLLARQGFRLPA